MEDSIERMFVLKSQKSTLSGLKYMFQIKSLPSLNSPVYDNVEMIKVEIICAKQ